MTYAVRSDYTARFGSQESARLDPMPPGDGRIDAAIAAASAVMDSELARAFTLPTAGTFPLLKEIALDLARERLFDTKPPEAVKAQADAARTLLDELVGGARRLVDSNGVEVPYSAGAAIVAPPQETRRNAGALRGFVGMGS